ncbi:MAG TPA: glycosyltransferase [Vicinamibacterales bacterium]|nr:glycosyltransferase [Vicinamibacterales bacterium]
MDKRPIVLAVMHRWHATLSSAFHDLAVTDLAGYAEIREAVWPVAGPVPDDVHAVLFCQILPPFEWIEAQRARVVWVPMWDDVSGHADAWWHQVPKRVKVVAFSRAVAARARAAGLEVLERQYFKDPAQLSRAPWDGERVLLYWNRRGMIGPGFLHKLCQALAIDRVLFRNALDPGADPGAAYELPNRLGRTVVDVLPRTSSRDEYFRLIDRVNVVVSPRLEEGVGMVMLEGLARGCAVFAADGPTMNEYIRSGVDGYLFRPKSFASRAAGALRSRLAGLGVGAPPRRFGLDGRQPWREIAAIELEALGRRARAAHVEGRARWVQALPDYVRFIVD